VQAAVFASVAHGLITGLLFFLAGSIKDRYGSTDLARLRALYGSVPRLAGVFAFAAMASLGLPGLAGFWGEVLAVRAAVDQSAALPEVTFRWLAFVAALGIILTSAYFLALMRSMLQGGPPRPVTEVEAASVEVIAETVPATPPLADVRGSEWLAWAPLLLLTVVLGVAPGLLLTPVAEATTSFLGGLR
jgi:NADH-quinone oxidoreductase subunit M